MRITTTGGERPAFGIAKWGASSSGTNAAQRYLHPEYSDSTVSTTAIEWDVPVAFTVTNMSVRVNTAGTGTGSLVYTLYRNSAATSITCTVLATATSGSTTGSVSFAVGDRISLVVQATGTIGGGGHGRPVVTVAIS